MKKLMMLLATAFAAAMPIMAATETVGGYTWTYRINGDTAEIYNDIGYDCGDTAVSPKPTGAVTIPSTLGGKPVTSIGSDAFCDCTNLTSVKIPDSVTSIGDRAFDGCSGLKSVTIPDSVKSIGSYAFYGCSGLTSVTIPSIVTSIGDWAFSWCSGLMSFSVASGNPSYKSVSGLLLTKDGTTLVAGVNGDVIIPDSVTSIRNSAFCGRSGLTSVTIPSIVTSIGDMAFSCCSGLMSFEVAEGNSAYKSVSGLLLTKDGKTLIAGVNGNVTIPSSVTRIGNHVFSYCSGLTSVTIPDSVTSIGDCAFWYCSGLTSVTIPDSVKSIGEYAFEYCSGLTSVTIPDSVTSIGWFAFWDTALKTVCVAKGDIDRVKSLLGGSGYYDVVTFVEDSHGSGYNPDIATHTVTFNANGGNVSPTSRTVSDGVAVGGLPVPARNGYSFVGWFTAANDGTQVMASTKVTGDVTYYAHWATAPTTTYTVRFDLNGHGALDDEEETMMLTANDVFGVTCFAPIPMVPNLADAGFADFQGWYTTNAGSGGAKLVDGTKVTKDITYYARWILYRFIRFDGNGGSVTQPDYPFVRNGASFGEALGSLPMATRSGYTLDGWYTTATGGIKVDTSTTLTADSSNLKTPVTYYAHWTRNGGGSVDIPVEWQKARTLNGVYGNPCTEGFAGTAQLKCGKANKKGMAKVSLTITPFNGKKRSYKSVSVDVSQGGTVEVSWPQQNYKIYIGDRYFDDDDYFFGEPIYRDMRLDDCGDAVWKEDIGGSFTKTTYFDFGDIPELVNKDDYAKWDEVMKTLWISDGNGKDYKLEIFAPVAVAMNGNRWTCPRATSMRWTKCPRNATCIGLWNVNTQNGTANPPGLKLSYNAKTGIFKGSFNIYAFWWGKKYKANVTGVMVNGIGFGQASCPKISSDSWIVTIE